MPTRAASHRACSHAVAHLITTGSSRGRQGRVQVQVQVQGVCAVLYCAALCCAVLRCTVWCRDVLLCAVQDVLAAGCSVLSPSEVIMTGKLGHGETWIMALTWQAACCVCDGKLATGSWATETGASSLPPWPGRRAAASWAVVQAGNDHLFRSLFHYRDLVLAFFTCACSASSRHPVGRVCRQCALSTTARTLWLHH